MASLSNIAVVVPAYEPSSALRDIVAELLVTAVSKVVVVDDGSVGSPVGEFLDDIDDSRLVLIRHDQNRGKGRALKTGFESLMAGPHSELRGVITADSDGQHLIEDIEKVASAAIRYPNSVVIGARALTGSSVPLRSKFGNEVTRIVFKHLVGQKITDTQSGLRFIPMEHLSAVSAVPGDRYEFELRMLTELSRHGIDIRQCEISTTYTDGNKSSHFRPIIDSARVYAVFARFCSVSMLSALVDLALFGLLVALGQSIFASTYIARSFSAAFNFLGNRYFAFRASGHASSISVQSAWYLALAICSASLSAALLSLLNQWDAIDLVLAKAVVDTCLFIVNFWVQKVFIFRAHQRD